MGEDKCTDTSLVTQQLAESENNLSGVVGELAETKNSLAGQERANDALTAELSNTSAELKQARKELGDVQYALRSEERDVRAWSGKGCVLKKI